MIYITIDKDTGLLNTFRTIRDMKKETSDHENTTYYHTPLQTITVQLIKLDGYSCIAELFNDMGLIPKKVSEARSD